MSRGLLDMPEVVMSKIMEDIDIKAILTLRQVCCDLRNYIDDVKPEANLEGLTINPRYCNSMITVDYHLSEGIHSIEYIRHTDGCWVNNEWDDKLGMGKLLKNEDVMTICMKDFEIVLGHQKSVLKYFTLNSHRYDNMKEKLWENLQRILESRIHPLKVETFITEYMDQTQLLSILPFLDSKTLSKIEIRNLGETLEIDQLINLDQWKNIKHLRLDGDVDFKFIQHFTHFTTNSIKFRATHFPDLVLLKNMFLQTPGFKNIEVLLTNHNFDESRISMEILGESLFDSDFKSYWNDRWYYRIPASNQILEMDVYGSFRSGKVSIKLSRIDEGRVPHDAVIQN